jgi:hypothetical protein
MSSRAIRFTETRISVGEASFDKARVALVIVAAVAILVPALIYGVPSNRDLFNHFRFALPFYDSLRSGHLYPAWLAESNSGYGDPSFRFYPPALYYLLGLARALAGNWYAATLLTFVLLSVLAGLGMYFWTRSILSGTTAMWAAVLYTLAPYHVNQLYQSFMIAEYAGAAVLPFAFGFVERVCRHRRLRDLAGLAATYAVLVLTHLPLSVIGSIALLLYALVRMDKRHGIATLKQLAAAAVLGLAASAIYWSRMITELHWIGLNDVAPDATVDYRNNFLFSTFSPDNLNVWWMNILTATTLLLFVPVIAFSVRSARSKLCDNKLKPVAALTLLSFFMAVPLSYPFWKVFTPLQQVQFPWRWLAVFSMAGSLLTAATLSLWFKSTVPLRRPVRIFVLGSMLVSVAFTLGHSVREAQYRNRQQFASDLQSIRGTSSIDFWIPIWSSSTPKTMKSDVEAGNRLVKVNQWEAESRSFEVAAGNPIEARVRTFYYPHWVATIDGRPLAVRPDSDGALLISVPAQKADVLLEFREPARARVAAILSLVGWIAIAGLSVDGKRNRVDKTTP